MLTKTSVWPWKLFVAVAMADELNQAQHSRDVQDAMVRVRSGEFVFWYPIWLQTFVIDLMTFPSTFNMTDASRALTFHIPRAFDKAVPAGLLHKLTDGFSDQLLSSVSIYLSNTLLFVAGAPESSIFSPVIFLLYNIYLPEGMSNFDDYSTHYSKCDPA